MPQKQLPLARETVDSLIAINRTREIGDSLIATNQERGQRQELVLSIINNVLDLLDEDDFDDNRFEDKKSYND
jgi:hypothetical protein